MVPDTAFLTSLKRTPFLVNTLTGPKGVGLWGGGGVLALFTGEVVIK